jgi:DNA-binding transcriptional regulator YhcF (GntR family)
MSGAASGDVVIAVDDELGIPPNRQIAEQIRSLVQRGELRSGALLPTVRQLAGDLGVAPNTVARAYADLQAEGWLVCEGRRGTRIAERSPDRDQRARTNTLRGSIEQFVASLVGRGYSRHEIVAEIERLAGA